jgi:hypothetical protein
MNSKSSPTLKEATKQAFRDLPDEFRGYQLHNVVKIITGRRKIYADSCFRKLRVLRKEKVLNYEILGDKGLSHYHKLP